MQVPGVTAVRVAAYAPGLPSLPQLGGRPTRLPTWAAAEMRASVEACEGRPSLAVTAPAGKHFMPDDAALARLGIRLVVYPQDILAATVHAAGALAALKKGAKPGAAPVADLATAIRTADYLALDERLSRRS